MPRSLSNSDAFEVPVTLMRRNVPAPSFVKKGEHDSNAFHGSYSDFCLPFLIHSRASGQTGDPGRSPGQPLKIGVALSGGGARGLAHIGVLRWFEKHRIPVDYLAGTSIGGLIGRMYAMGVTPSEIGDFIHSVEGIRRIGCPIAVIPSASPLPDAADKEECRLLRQRPRLLPDFAVQPRLWIPLLGALLPCGRAD